MADFCSDQAAGLRRLFNRRQLKVVSFASGTPGVGKTSIIANVATALARQGQEVLIVDENTGQTHMSAFFGAPHQGDLLQVLNRKRTLEEVLCCPVPGVSILPAGKAARQLGHLSASQQAAMQEGVNALERSVDILLVDTSPDHDIGFSPWGLAAGEAVMVVSGSGASITDSYALIKKVSLAFARRHFRILVNRVKTLEEGQTIYANLKKVAAQRNVAQLEFGGAVPLDANLKQASQLCQPLVFTLPESAAAVALKDFAADLLSWPRADYEHGGVEQFIGQLLRLSHRVTPMVLRA
jgi:flagellar biosynthesis protein FlhG